MALAALQSWQRELAAGANAIAGARLSLARCCKTRGGIAGAAWFCGGGLVLRCR